MRGADAPALVPFFGEHAGLADAAQFKAWLAPLRKAEWVVYAKPPFAGPKAVLARIDLPGAVNLTALDSRFSRI